MSDTAQILLFFGLLWGGALCAGLWIRWRLKKDAAEDRARREMWSAVVPRPGCMRNIPGCICAREDLGERCVWRAPERQGDAC